MVYSFRSVCSKSTKAFFSAKTAKKSEYLIETSVSASFCLKAAIYIWLPPIIWAIVERWINVSGISRVATYNTKVFDSLFNATLANFFLLISFTRLMVCRPLAIVYNFQISIFSWNWIFALLKVRKDILKITFTLVSANKNVS